MAIWSSIARVAIPSAAIGATTVVALLSTEDDRSAVADKLPFCRRLLAATNPAVKENTLSWKTPQVDPDLIKWDRNWDCRLPETLVKPEKLAAMDEKTRAETIAKLTPKATRHILLIRHGQYHLDADIKSLTQLGRDQAVATGERLRALGLNYDTLIYSTMTRATETAKLIAEKLPDDLPQKNDVMLEEGSPYPPEPKLGNWRASNRFLTSGTRIEAAFRKYFHRADPEQVNDSYEVIACHANVIRYFVCRALQFPPEGWLRFSLANGSITWILIRPSGRVIIKSFGDHGHMPPKLITFT